MRGLRPQADRTGRTTRRWGDRSSRRGLTRGRWTTRAGPSRHLLQIELLDRAQAGRLGAGVGGDLLGGVRTPGAPAEQPHGGPDVGRDGQVGRAGPAAGLGVAEALLDDAVLARVVGDGDAAPPAPARRWRRRGCRAGWPARRSPRCGWPGRCGGPGGRPGGGRARARRRARRRPARPWWRWAAGRRWPGRCARRSARRRRRAADGASSASSAPLTRSAARRAPAGPCACRAGRRRR